MRHGILPLLILVLIASIARSWFWHDGAENDRFEIGDIKHVNVSQTTTNTTGYDTRVNTELETRLSETVSNDRAGSKISVTNFRNTIDIWIIGFVDTVTSIKMRDFGFTDYHNDAFIFERDSSSVGTINVNEGRGDVFIVRDKDNESIMFLGKLTGSDKWASE